jgi:hypothetical protein
MIYFSGGFSPEVLDFYSFIISQNTQYYVFISTVFIIVISLIIFYFCFTKNLFNQSNVSAFKLSSFYVGISMLSIAFPAYGIGFHAFINFIFLTVRLFLLYIGIPFTHMIGVINPEKLSLTNYYIKYESFVSKYLRYIPYY